MTFYEKITKAKQGATETVSDVDIMAVMWPESQLQAQRVMFSRLKTKGADLTESKIRKLVKLFPNTDGSFWVG